MAPEVEEQLLLLLVEEPDEVVESEELSEDFETLQRRLDLREEDLPLLLEVEVVEESVDELLVLLDESVDEEVSVELDVDDVEESSDDEVLLVEPDDLVELVDDEPLPLDLVEELLSSSLVVSELNPL